MICTQTEATIYSHLTNPKIEIKLLKYACIILQIREIRDFLL